MDTIWWVIIAAAVAIVVVALVAQAYMRSRRRAVLRDQFGPEYDRAVGSAGSHRAAERELSEREKARDELDIRPLSEDARARFTDDWQRAEGRFMDDPELAAREADRVVHDVLEERGYPSDDFDTQANAVSVDYPKAVQRYRRQRADREPPEGDGRLPLGVPRARRCRRARRQGRARRVARAGDPLVARGRKPLAAPDVQPRRAPL
jgi:hypothetical protein